MATLSSIVSMALLLTSVADVGKPSPPNNSHYLTTSSPFNFTTTPTPNSPKKRPHLRRTLSLDDENSGYDQKAKAKLSRSMSLDDENIAKTKLSRSMSLDDETDKWISKQRFFPLSVPLFPHVGKHSFTKHDLSPLFVPTKNPLVYRAHRDESLSASDAEDGVVGARASSGGIDEDVDVLVDRHGRRDLSEHDSKIRRLKRALSAIKGQPSEFRLY